jgi:lipoate-protein ligase A
MDSVPAAFRLLNLGPTAWTRTLSVCQATAELLPPGAPGAVIFAQSLHPYVSCGAQAAPEAVFDLDTCRERGWPAVRRPLPGAAEYCDVEQMLVQWVLPRAADAAVERISAALLVALEALGVRAEWRDGDLLCGGARLGSLARGPLGAAQVVLARLFLAYDPRHLALACRAPQAERATGLWLRASRPLPPDAVQQTLLECFEQHLGATIRRDTPRVPETRRAKALEQALLAASLPVTNAG